MNVALNRYRGREQHGCGLKGEAPQSARQRH